MLFVLLIRATESLFQSFHVFCMLAFKYMRQDGFYSILGQRLIRHFQIPFFLRQVFYFVVDAFDTLFIQLRFSRQNGLRRCSQ